MINLPSYDKPLRIVGIIKVVEKASKYGIPKGLYPVIYFEERSVQIPIDLDEPDFIYISREDIDEWLEFERY